MASADALDDDWWLAEEDGRRTIESEPSRKRSRPTQSDTLQKEEKKKTKDRRYQVLHSLSRQRDELSHTLELKLKKSYFTSCGQGNDGSLSVFAQEVFPNGTASIGELKERGTPLLIVLTCSASRAVQLKKELAQFAGSATVAKLFARHMKVEEQSSFLSSHTTPLAVATPTRLKQLLDINAVSVDRLQVLILDWYWRDAKLRRFADIPEVWKSFVGLFHSDIHTLVRTKGVKLALY